MSSHSQTLLAEIDSALRGVSHRRHLEMLRQTTDLFFAHAGSYTPEQVELFDAVIKRLSQNISSRDLIELSAKLATLDGAPEDTIQHLSENDDIAVSGPVLERSNALKDSVLVAIAKTKSQGHLLAIAGRATINDSVTDVLVDRGDAAVRHKVIINEGAAFSEFGFARLVSAASKDRKLAEYVSQREDIPAELQSFLEMTLAS